MGTTLSSAALGEALSCAILVYDGRGNLAFANEAARQLLRLPPGGWDDGVALSPGRAWFDPQSGAEIAAADLPPLQSLRMGLALRGVAIGLRLPGEEVLLRFDAVPAREADGTISAVIATIYDDTATIHVQAALRDGEARFRTVFDRIATGLVRLDTAGRVVECNAAFARMLGLTSGDIAGSTLAAWAHPEDALPLRRHLRKLLNSSADGFQAELRFARVDGDVVWAACNGSAEYRGHDGTCGCLVAVDDVTERKAQTETLERQALYDGLTALPNRVMLCQRLRQAIQAAQQDTLPLALLLLDLDRFKDVNDTLGHHYGDLLLQQVGPRLHDALRQNDVVARLGGDEFAILLPGAGQSGATEATRKLLKAIEEPFVIDGQSFDVGASIGIALYPAHGADVETLLRHADVAMYVAKRAHSGYALYATGQEQPGASRLALTGELRAAVEQDELVVYYQPKVSLHSRRVSSVEALVRWQHPSRGLMMPGEFVGVADQTGSIRPPSLWVLQEALRQCRAWQQDGLPLGLSVNLSGRNLHDPELPDTIAALLHASGVTAEWLKVEVSESAVMADPARALEALSRLSALDVRIAVDDFGVGYAPLAYLQRLPMDEIKIDRSYIAGLRADDHAAKIVRSTIDLGHGLGARVVAVGVESRETWELLAEMGCDAVQGYYLCHPQPAPQMERWLHESSWGVGGYDLVI